MAQDAIRYGSGRFIAALFTAGGWLGVFVVAALLILRLLSGVKLAEAVPLAFMMGWPLACVLLGQISRAIFDMAERTNTPVSG